MLSICASASVAQPRNERASTTRPSWKRFQKKVGVSLGVASLCLSVAFGSSAAARKVGEFNASGFVFKDSIEVISVDDPEVSGVTLYVSDFKRSLADKLSSMDFINEPSQSSVTCAITGPIQMPELNSLGGKEGKEVFKETKSRAFLVFGNKTLRIRRIYDSDRNTLTYISYATRIGSAGEEGNVGTSRYRTSICVLPIPETNNSIP